MQPKILWFKMSVVSRMTNLEINNVIHFLKLLQSVEIKFKTFLPLQYLPNHFILVIRK